MINVKGFIFAWRGQFHVPERNARPRSLSPQLFKLHFLLDINQLYRPTKGVSFEVRARACGRHFSKTKKVVIDCKKSGSRCWCVDVLMTVLMTVLMCWCADVFIHWWWGVTFHFSPFFKRRKNPEKNSGKKEEMPSAGFEPATSNVFWCVDDIVFLCCCVAVLPCWCVDDCVDDWVIVLIWMYWCVGVLLCWCVDVLMRWIDVLFCWCVDVLMYSCVDVLRCWCVDVLMCWCVDVLMSVLRCCCVDVCCVDVFDV